MQTLEDGTLEAVSKTLHRPERLYREKLEASLERSGEGVDEDLAELVRNVLLDPEAEGRILDVVTRELGTIYAKATQDGGIVVDAEITTTMQGALPVLAALVHNPTISSTTLEGVVELVRKETGKRFYFEGCECVGLIAALLPGFLDTGPDLTHAQQEEIIAFAFSRQGSEPYPKLHLALLENSWFCYPKNTLVSTCLRYPQGQAHLSRAAVAVERETWEALLPNWRGTVEELLEACALVGGGKGDMDPWW